MTFEPFAINISPIIYDKQLRPQPDTLAFRDMLLEACSTEAGTKVLKINLFVTPNQPDFNGLGFLYLEDKTILPVKLEQSEHLKAWAKHLTEDTSFGKKTVQDWLLDYSADECRMKGMAHEWEGKSYAIKDYDIYTETGKFLFDNSPKQFNLKQIAAEKKNYLKKYINTNGPELDLAETLRLFEKLVASCKAETNPPLENAAQSFETFKEESGYELPTELKAIYQMHNGFSQVDGKPYYFLGAEELLQDWKSWMKVYDEWLLEELQVHESDGQKTLPMYVTPYWVPFMGDGNGNFIAIDYAPGKKGRAGQVIVFGADEEKITVLAENLNEFLDNFPF